jgi:hypothetical protein
MGSRSADVDCLGMYRTIIEIARQDARAREGAGVVGLQSVKYQRIDGSRPWAMLELDGAHDDDSRRDGGGNRAGLLALLHTAIVAAR